MTNTWDGKNVLITGANGFLGSWLLKKLISRGANTTSLIYEEITSSLFHLENLGEDTNIVNGDLLDFEMMKNILKENEIEIVFHLAAQAINKTGVSSPHMTLETNIRGTYNLLEAVRVVSPNTKIVIASSDKAYGIHDKMPLKENFPLHGEYPYEVSKTCADLISTSYYKTYNLPICIVRSGNIYGEGDWHFSRVVPASIVRIHKKLPPLLIKETERDYSYVGDIAEGYLKLGEKMFAGMKGESLNLGSGEPIKTSKLLTILLNVMNQESLGISKSNETRVEIPLQYLSVEKARNLIDFSTSTKIEEGLKKTSEWYIDNIDKMLTTTLRS